MIGAHDNWGHASFPAGLETRRVPTRQSGFTLIELVVSLLVITILFAGLNSVINGLLGSTTHVEERIALTRDAEFAMDRMVRNVSHSRLLLLPLVDKSLSDWPENVREQTVPPSPPVGSSTLATAVLAVTLPASSDLDFDGFPDADNDRDGHIDEDVLADRNNDFASGIFLIDDGGDGSVDEGFFTPNDDDEYFNDQDDDPENGLDDDNDSNVDEDPPSDANADGCPGACGVDDDADGQVDEGGADDDDEDGQSNEDWYDALVYYLDGSELKERVPVPWDESGVGGVTGRDFIVSTIADNVTRIRFERIPVSAGQSQLVGITLELTTQAAGTASLNRRVRVGGAL